MRRCRLMSGSLCLAIVSAAGAQTAVGPVSVTKPAAVSETAPRGQRSFPVANDHCERAADLTEAAAQSEAVLDAVLVHTAVTTPPGMKVLVTEYTFEVFETLKGDAPSLITVRESGGRLPDGSGVCTVDSHRLVNGGRYLVFLEHGHEEVLFPFVRVLQIMDSGTKLADERGRVLIGMKGGTPVVRQQAEGLTMNYLGKGPEAPAPVRVGAPDITSQPLPEQPADVQAEDHGPIAASAVLALLRAPGVQAPAAPQPAGLNSLAVGAMDYIRCGFIDGSVNFACLFPDDGPWSWFNTAETDWDNLVNWTNSGGWLYGLRASGGVPIRNEVPDGNNGRHNAGTPSSAQMIAGGYGSWAANDNPNGICFTWFDSSCGRIREVDAFVNPVNIPDELQFRKSMVHELGHGLGFDHEDRYVANMVAGTWRVPPNYSSDYYNRMDECRAGRNMIGAANNATASWDVRDWRDIATVAQAHPDWGTSGDVRYNVTSLSDYSVSTGQTIQIQRMYVENRGNVAYAGEVEIKVYFSLNTTISAADYDVWTGSWATFPAHGYWNNGTLDITIGPEIPTGDYYIGWILSAAESELTSGNNTGIMVRNSDYNFSERTVHVTNTVPLNNSCASATVINNGTTPFTTVNASTDGPAEPACSFCCGDDQVHKDVWFRYTATCTGLVSVDTCGSLFDTKLAVYGSCPGGPGTALACNDDACSLQSRLTFAAVAGHTYRIRVGGYNGDSGTGDITIACNPCYANCDASTTPPILNVQDFACFLNRFGAGDPWANCDGSSVAPVLNVQDFACFLNRFSAGCS